MSANTVYCHVLEGNVTVVSDLNGQVTNVVCPKFYRITHGCQKKKENSGFIGQIARNFADSFSGSRLAICEFGNPNHVLGK